MSGQTFLHRLSNGEVLVADGATGTNLIARGMPNGETPETWVFSHPEQILQLHRDFIAAGAEILLTSTFGATSLRLADGSLAGRSAEVNQRAVALARMAADGTTVLVAGSLGPVGKLLKPYGPLDPAEIESTYAGQAEALTQAGADLLVIETQFDINEAAAAVIGARSVSSLPIVASFSYDRGRRTMMGIGPAKAAAEMEKLGVDVIGINCGHSLEENLQNLVELRQATNKPIWYKPNAGLPHVDAHGTSLYDTSPEAMGALVPGWLAAGAQVVGGCCGTSPDHLRQIARNTVHAS